jgi:DNA polymerase II large subunit
VGWGYPDVLYREGGGYGVPGAVRGVVDVVEDRLDKVGRYEGFGFSHPTDLFDVGPEQTVYKTLGTMSEKVMAQLEVCRVVDAVDEQDVGGRILSSHFFPDIFGNLKRFSSQKFRCVNCNRKYRRPPLKGVCTGCGGKLILTVSKGFVTKYFDISEKIIKEYNLSKMFRQRMRLARLSVDSLFKKEKKNQVSLSDFV